MSQQTVGVPLNQPPRRSSFQSDVTDNLREGLAGIPSDEFVAPMTDVPLNGLGIIPQTQTFLDLSLPGSMALAGPLEGPERKGFQRDVDPVGDSTYVAVAGPSQGNNLLAPTPSQMHSRYPRTIESSEDFFRCIKEDLVVVYYFAEWCPPCRVGSFILRG
jgi:hypothetical protein